MAVLEQIGVMTYIDEYGNKTLLYPVIKKECIEGLGKINGFTNEVEGSEVIIRDALNYQLEGFELYGKGEQNGEPTPANPIEIKNVGKYNPETGKYEVEVTASGKNLLEITGISITKSGITFTVNNDGSVTANGTAIESVWFVTNSSFKLPKGRYRMHGCPNGGSNSTYATQLYKVESTGQIVPITDEYGQGVIFDITESSTLEHDIVIRKGTTVNNLVFYPMIIFESITDLSFEKYKGFITETLESSQPFRSSKDGSVRDVRSFDGDVIRIKEVVFDGSDDEMWDISPNLISIDNALENFNFANQKDNLMCSYGIYQKTNYSPYLQDKVYAHSSWFGIGYDGSTITEEEWRALLAENPMVVQYELTEPIIEKLSETELAKLKRLQTFNPTTIITNSDDCEMKVEYVADTKIYIDNKFKELETALANTNAQLL